MRELPRSTLLATNYLILHPLDFISHTLSFILNPLNSQSILLTQLEISKKLFLQLWTHSCIRLILCDIYVHGGWLLLK